MCVQRSKISFIFVFSLQPSVLNHCWSVEAAAMWLLIACVGIPWPILLWRHEYCHKQAQTVIFFHVHTSYKGKIAFLGCVTVETEQGCRYNPNGGEKPKTRGSSTKNTWERIWSRNMCDMTTNRRLWYSAFKIFSDKNQLYKRKDALALMIHCTALIYLILLTFTAFCWRNLGTNPSRFKWMLCRLNVVFLLKSAHSIHPG